MSDVDLRELIASALARRAALRVELAAEATDAYRLFHGIAEGWPGLSVDRYGPLVLAQEFREPLSATARAAVREALEPLLSEVGATLAFRARYRGAPTLAPTEPLACREFGATFRVAAQHRGLDPWLFLDFRCVRRWLREHAAGRSVLNLFAYTCTVGVAAARAGAREVVNVDFAASNLDVGRANAQLNGVADRMQFVQENCLPVLRQLAGQSVHRPGVRLRYTKVAPRQFDLVVLDPPPFAKTPFGAIDSKHDYASLFKPALLCLAPGGTVIAANNRADVSWAEFEQRLRRSAEKAGRPLRELQRLLPEADFPSFDGEPPLKVALARAD
jgi:23S rRNA (cytosine1962-C5)-methyltransferase